MSTILITGGAGYIGCHTVLELLNKGHIIVVLDSFITSSEKNLTKIKNFLKNKKKYILNNLHIFKSDLRDYQSIDKIFKTFELQNLSIDSVIHFAGLKNSNESINEPIQYWDNNVVGSINLFKIMEKYNCRNIVFSSSATIYDASLSDEAINEDCLKKPTTPYGESKYTIEKILESIHKASNKKWSIINLRYFNPIGAHELGIIGEDPLNSSHNIFPSILNVAFGNKKEINIFGADWPTIDGTGVRDYIHVMDLADAHILSLEKLERSNNEIINLNIGTGLGTSVLELISIFEEVNSVKIKKSFSSRRKGDYGKVIANNYAALKFLDWRPKRSLQDMCKDGYNFRKSNKSL